MNGKLGRVLAEVLVVFVGVYAAFALDEYRSTKEEDVRRQQIISALEKDFTSSLETLDELVPVVTAVIDSTLDAYDAGEMPTIGHLAVSVSFRSGTWEAMLASGGVTILDTDLIFEVEDYYEHVQALVDAASEGRSLSAQLILPELDRGNDWFYDTSTGKLKRKYAWYMFALRDYKVKVVELQRLTREILGEIKKYQ